MFFDQTDSSPGSAGQQAVLHSTPSRTASFWIWFSLSALCNLLSFALNSIFSIVGIMERNGTFRNSFYAIVIVFSLIVAVSSCCRLTYEFVIAFTDVQSKAFSSPSLYERLSKRKTMRCVLLGLVVFSIMDAILIYNIGGLKRAFEEDTVVDYASEVVLFQVSNYIFHALPLVSSVFYIAAYLSLRSKREDAISDNTISLLDSAEKITLNQGIWILIIYFVRFFESNIISHMSSLFTL
ncbi:hypothetical protein COOONC_17334 [Cooperia oncophora]